MQKKKKSATKKTSSTVQKNNEFARNLNIFIALAGLSYTIFLVLSKWSQIQQSMEMNGVNGLSVIRRPRLNLTGQKTHQSPAMPSNVTLVSPVSETSLIMEDNGDQADEFVPPLENECIPPPDIKALSTVKPKYLTNPNAFLVPILIWGPNNQIRGFIETVFLAIKLNRTLLIPPFFRHQSELGSYNDHASILPPERVIDLDSLARIVSITTYEAARAKCAGHIQTVLLNRMCNTGPQYERLLQFQTYSNLRFLKEYETVEYIKRYVVSEDETVSDFFSADIRPKDYSILQKLIALHLPHESTELHELYSMNPEKSPCAAWVFPYRAFDFRAVGLSRNWKHQTIAFENKRFRDGIPVPYDDAEKMRDIYSMLRRPRPVVEVASSFIKDVIMADERADYMAVHWRFEAAGGEFGGKVQTLCKSQNSRCKKILELHENPERVARSLVAQMQEWKLKVIYIASPPDDSNFIAHIIGLIRSVGYRGYSGENLEDFLPDCYLSDSQVFSSIEQEICSQSYGFLYSPGSSWSLNTAIERNCRMQTLYASLESILEFGSTKSSFLNQSST